MISFAIKLFGDQIMIHPCCIYQLGEYLLSVLCLLLSSRYSVYTLRTYVTISKSSCTRLQVDVSCFKVCIACFSYCDHSTSFFICFRGLATICFSMQVHMHTCRQKAYLELGFLSQFEVSLQNRLFSVNTSYHVKCIVCLSLLSDLW